MILLSFTEHAAKLLKVIERLQFVHQERPGEVERGLHESSSDLWTTQHLWLFINGHEGVILLIALSFNCKFALFITHLDTGEGGCRLDNFARLLPFVDDELLIHSIGAFG